jgi:glycosyltransferase involved in cell wall biosynthesis
VKIYFCTKGDITLPSSRTRAHLVAEYLRTLGYNAQSFHIKRRAWWVISYERLTDFFYNIKLLAGIKKDDVLYLHKMTEQLDFMFMVLIRKWIFRRTYFFDFDDAIFIGTWNMRFKAWIMVKNAQGVIVGSHYLQEYALTYNKNSHVLSAPIDTENVYINIPKHKSESSVRIGWTGTPGHYENMKLLIKPLQRIVDEGYSIVFVLLGGGEKIYELMSSVRMLNIEFTKTLPWHDPSAVVKELNTFDIGVMPLVKNQQSKGKDSWKAKEYMGCGIATVLTDWGENRYVVSQNVNGILVDTDEDWYQALKKLITDSVFRKTIGNAGREYMKKEFSNKPFITKLLKIILPLHATSKQ